MGQAESVAAASPPNDLPQSRNSAATPVSSSSRDPPSMDSLIAEAAAYGNEANESLDAKANRALECPCIADLRKGPCGVQFSDAFLCFFKSTAEEKGSDCVHPFVALQSCIKANPNAFSKDILDEEEKEEKEKEKAEEPAEDYRIIPPSWSREPQIPKSKL
ncbi:mitochondrial intermembrane space import and assembly protein 40 homolog [Momordica charantia]|uniref:Mitochondrial intermembrane space import and assembly protein 40 homolog n=1 Tax=Momordica charantia TaxID=3673 RepID=A0A6J1CJ21_MOMCH|nr:mitochondrial intermembrane space import and assembly protein 40 homolog [Momordica charantia]